MAEPMRFDFVDEASELAAQRFAERTGHRPLPRVVGEWDVPSAEAAEKAKEFRGPQHLRILDALEFGVLTDEGIARIAAVGPNSIRARLRELAETGAIVAVDRDGVTSAGGKCRRWRLA